MSSLISAKNQRDGETYPSRGTARTPDAEGARARVLCSLVVFRPFLAVYCRITFIGSSDTKSNLSRAYGQSRLKLSLD